MGSRRSEDTDVVVKRGKPSWRLTRTKDQSLDRQKDLVVFRLRKDPPSLYDSSGFRSVTSSDTGPSGLSRSHTGLVTNRFHGKISGLVGLSSEEVSRIVTVSSPQDP